MYLLCYSITCTDGCDPVQVTKDAKLKVTCDDDDCEDHVWYVDDQRLNSQWPVSRNRLWIIWKWKNSKTAVKRENSPLHIDLSCILIYLQSETRSCYQAAETRPLELKQNGGQRYSVSRSTLALAFTRGRDVKVVVTFDGTYTWVRFLTI